MKMPMDKNFKDIIKHPAYFLACGFGSGLSPVASGTTGTMAAIPILLLLSWAGLETWQYLLIVVAVIFSGVWLCGKTSKDFGVDDHPAIVWDEFAGFFVTMVAVPVTWYWVLAGFFLFRLFDVIKPWPANWLETNLPGGWGIMMDDVQAGIYAWAVLQILILYLN